MAPSPSANLNPTYRGRVRTGCGSCRTAKVRCDEQRPICKRCMRLQRPCSYRLRPPISSNAQSPDGSVDTMVGTDTMDRSPPETIVRSQSAASTPASQIRTPSLQSMMTSQDIYLCTTIDLMAVGDPQHSITYFVQKVECFTVTLFDNFNWQLCKEHIAHMATQSADLTAAILAVQSIHKAQANGIPPSKGLALYQTAIQQIEHAVASDIPTSFDTIFATVFLLCFAHYLIPEQTRFGPLLDEDSILWRRIIAEIGIGMSALSRRMTAWLLVAHAAARRGGNAGLLCSALRDRMVEFCQENILAPILPTDTRVPVAAHVSMLATLSAPVFDMCLKIQIIAGKSADLSHYHRSRVTSDDQEEVAVLLGSFEQQMHETWEQRTSYLRCDPAEIRELMSEPLAEVFLLHLGICQAMYHTEMVEFGRILSDPPFASKEARRHMHLVRKLLEDSSWSTALTDEQESLHTGFLRPLFLYAIESIYESESAWAIKQIRRIKNPICRSDFFASFAEGLSQAQREKQRRVTTRWYCLKAFEVTPPFL